MVYQLYKNLFRVIGLMLLPQLLLAQEDSIQTLPTEKGIQFIREDFKTAMAQAAEKNKLVFVDAYTTWCGPCKLMDKSVFMDEKISRFMNDNFVCLKLDMEKNDGAKVAQRYKVEAYPSYLFLNSDGELVHKGLGYLDPDKFLALTNVALNANEGLLAWSRKYNAGEKSPEFLKNYALQLADVQDVKRLEVAKRYIQWQKDWKDNNETLDFIIKFMESPDDTFFTIVSKNMTIFERRVTREALELKRKNLVEEQLFDKKNLPSLGRADSLLALINADPKKLERARLNYRTTYYRMKGDRAAYAQAAVNYFKKYDDNANELNETSNTFYEQIEDTHFLKRAVKWAKRATVLEKSQSNQLLVAQLYAKLKDTKAAIKASHLAAEMGKAAGENTDDTLAFIKQLEQQK